MSIISVNRKIGIMVLGWTVNKEHPAYEDTKIIWQGYVRKKDAIEMAVHMVDDLMLRGAWVVAARGNESINQYNNKDQHSNGPT
jgi:hypothetical protein